MIEKLTQRLGRDFPASTLVFYGDHVPSMPTVYDKLGFDDGRSDYFIWSATPEQPVVTEKALRAEELARHALLAAGLIKT